MLESPVSSTMPPLPPEPPFPASQVRPVGQVATFLDLIKFAHSVFALPFALIAAFWAFRVSGITPLSGRALRLLSLVLACMVFARTWAMTFNRLVDRRFDAANPRTAKRPSVTGAVSVGFMRGTLAICFAGFLLATAGFLYFEKNEWPLLLAVPVLGWLAAYSYTKRFTSLCHFWLGISLGLAPISAWIAIGPEPEFGLRHLTILLLGGGVALWVAGFDILYALQDEAFDRGERLHSIPARVGRAKALLISRGCHVACILLFAGVGGVGGFHALYWCGFGCAVLLLAIEQSIVSAKDISRINIAFMTANGLIGLLFGALAIADTLVW
jgi:4-hydroxybenzoate polyprenyltransferase